MDQKSLRYGDMVDWKIPDSNLRVRVDSVMLDSDPEMFP